MNIYKKRLLAWTIILTIFSWASLDAQLLAATYYIDATAGNDSFAGTQDRPWKTLSKVNTSMFAPGDSILLKRGQFWRETLSPTSSGSPDGVIFIGPYGDGPNPVILGTDLITEWVCSKGTSFWHSPLISQPGEVFFDGAKGTRKESVPAMVADRDWYYDQKNKELWIFSTPDPNSSFKNPGIEASLRDTTVYIDSRGCLTLECIDCKNAKGSSLAGSMHIVNSNHITLQLVNIYENHSLAGIVLQSSSSNNVQYCNIYNNAHETEDRGIGIIIDGPGGKNTISDNNVFNNQGNGIKIGMWQGSDENRIYRNIIYLNGSSGISINGMNNTANIVEDNTVYENCRLVPDRYNIDLFKVGDNNIVRYNLVHDSIFVNLESGGIRFDAEPGGFFGANNKIYYNIIYNEMIGIHLLGCSGAAVYNNTIYNSRQYGINIHGSDANLNIVKNNAIISSEKALICNQDAENSDIDYNAYYPDSSSAFIYNGKWMNYDAWKSVTGTDVHSIVSDCQMVDATGRNFQLKSSSPCIDSGVNIGLVRDFNGNPVPIRKGVDIGAIEHKTALSSPESLR